MKTLKISKKVFLKLLIILFIGFAYTYNVIAKDKLEELSTTLDSYLSDVNCMVSVQVVSADKYDLLYENNPSAQMIPASITKLVTAAVAFQELGVSYNFRTVVYTDDSDIKDGIINGNLYLKGYGDPDLSSTDIAELAKLISEKNIREITGNIIYDETYLDDDHYGLANYYKDDTKQNYWPYISAINFNKNGGGYDPASVAASYLSDELVSNFVKVDGIVISGVTPQGAKEIAEVYNTFFDVISRMNKESDNHSAITVFKVIGAKHDLPPGSIKKGEDAVTSYLTSIGNPRNYFEIVEGSGLSRHNSVNSDMYVRLLKSMYDDEKTFDLFYNTLAIAGIDGTLRNRMKGTEAEKNIHAKTGTLNSVSSLTGYAVSRDGELLIFYISMNGFGSSANAVRYKQDMICEELCKFSRK
ncbi:MAG TPA: D-alanyl-D-alanine carboxypeptidase/D-alanyl-D-alanine-endopeptidase [Ignavibacteria bacterium]|nr:D-alanyl-D-alanine carboxypeptidase/D-alanyl-D-alanine-endopeptidase [Ignavibacteria bacterium]